MATLWKCFFWSAVGIGASFAAFFVFVSFAMSRPHVHEYGENTGVTPAAISCTLSNSLPEKSTAVYYARASVGLGGRLLLYRFTAPLPDLYSHAEAEFAAHWDHLTPSWTPDSPSPIDDPDIRRLGTAYGIAADWMLPPPDAKGSLYVPADGEQSHRPKIFVDDANRVLYFVMTD